ncbi:MAG TPA: response regulator [Thermoanaerobaculia bacterium]|jgi:CheY-like chemotaxis protein|nr:response regulator [Thermoanaerobaculia bacterium]
MTNEAAGAKDGKSTAPWAGGSEAILLVEDDAILRDLFSSVLGQCGYEVSVAANGNEALAAVHRRPGRFGLVISDVQLPGMSGVELARQLRAEGESVPILLLSGYGDADLASVTGLAVTLAEKPVRPAVLARKVRELLDAR